MSAEAHKYDYYRSAGTPVLFLHGWGGDIRSFGGAFSAVKSWGLPCINYEFPRAVPSDWGIYDYAAHTEALLRELCIDKPIIVGHSFGGRVATVLAAQDKVKKLVLVDSAGMKPRPSLRTTLSVLRYKRARKHGKPLDGFGSKDYNELSCEMRQVFVRVVNTHLEKLLPYISCPTLIFWGKQDKATPLYMAKRLAEGIKNSRLVAVEGGHYSYIDANYAFLRELKSFIS